MTSIELSHKPVHVDDIVVSAASPTTNTEDENPYVPGASLARSNVASHCIEKVAVHVAPITAALSEHKVADS